MELRRQKLYAALLLLGGGILLFRTIRLLTVENGWETLANWVIALTFIEMLADLICIIYSLKWFINIDLKARSVALKLGAFAAIFHAFRVLIYVLGRTGPWINFDLKQEFRDIHEVNMFWVIFAAVLSVLGIIGVIVIWAVMKNRKIKKET